MKFLRGLGRLLAKLAYPAFFFGCYVAFCYWTFPYDRLRDTIVARVTRPMPQVGRPPAPMYELEIGELEPYYLTGVELSSVRIRKLPQSDQDPQTVAANFPHVVARVSILPLLLGRIATSIDVETPTGVIDADVGLGVDGQLRALRAELTDVNLRHLASAGLAGKVPLRGMLGGEVELDLGSGKANGQVDLSVRGLEVGDGTTRVPLPGTVLAGGLTLETIHAGNLRLAADFVDGEARLRELRGRGADLELAGVGSMRLDRDPRLVRLDFFVQAKFTDAYRQRNDRTRSMFQLMEMNARVRQARASNGAWQFRLRGSPSTQLIPEPAGRERFPPPDGGAR